MAANMVNILMTGGGAPGAAGIIHCLQKDNSVRVIAADARDNVVGKWLAEDFTVIPHAKDPKFTDAILSVCRENNIHVILPLVTAELIPLASRLDEFELAGARIPVSPASSLEIANNKSRLYEFLQWRDIPLPLFRVVENIEQFDKAVEELGYPGKNVCIKPSVSNGSRGFRVISSNINELDHFLNQKPDSTFITLRDIRRILSSAPFPEMILSEWLPGDEYSIDCLANHGSCILAIPRLRKKMIGGISVEGSFVNHEEIIAYCKKIIRELKLHGNIGIQVKQSEKNEFLILEINPRLQGSVSAALGVGINFPLLAVRQELDLPINPTDLEPRWDRHFIRYWTEVFY